MAKQLNLDRIYAELDKSEDRKELSETFELIKDFVIKKLNAEHDEKASEVEEIGTLIKKINGN